MTTDLSPDALADSFAGMLADGLDTLPPTPVRGRVRQVVGTVVKATSPGARLGEVCRFITPGAPEVLAEVVGFTPDGAVLTPLAELGGVSTATEVVATGQVHTIPVGPGLRGRVLDGLGRPMDGRGPVAAAAWVPVIANPPNPMARRLIGKPLELGVRSVDGLLTCGEGQRMGIFAAAGGGKSTLLATFVRNTAAEVVVLALIGERGREVREFIEHDLGTEGLARAVLVVATSDRPAMERLKAAYVATAVAEHFRDQGAKVLLLMDSVTRFARAQREIGLAAGEPATRRGFPPSVFATLPLLLERAGNSDKGSITALYTVLVEGDDMTEPVADETRSLLDGHIILSRALGAANHYPAVDVLASVSRVMNAIAQPDHKKAAGRFRELLAKYDEVEVLLRLGEYRKGNDAVVDEAVEKIDRLRGFLKQGTQEKSSFAEAVSRMKELTGVA